MSMTELMSVAFWYGVAPVGKMLQPRHSPTKEHGTHTQ